MTGNYTTMINDTQWCKGTAYIVETRIHPNFPIVLENAHRCLPPEWEIVVFCTGQTFLYMDQEIRRIVGRSIRIVELERSISSLKDYNNLLFSKWFWQQFDTENLLGFQVDSLLSDVAKEKLADIAQYDYVGAPWNEEIQQRWDYIPVYGGNGGVCFSKRSCRLKALESACYPRVTGAPHHQVLNEDIWFSHAFNELGFRMPEPDVAKSFFVESVYSPSPFAVHKPWCYLSKQDYASLTKQFSLLESIKSGCSKKVKTLGDDSYRRFLLRFARECLKVDNYYQADLALQVSQNRFPDDSRSYNLQAMLAHHLGLFEQANRFVDKAIERDPTFNKAIENKTYIERAYKKQLESQGDDTDKRYLLIHSWGSGLGFDLLYLLKQLMLAELTNREPMVYWGANSLYNDQPESDCFIDYFNSVSSLSFDDIEPFRESCYPSYWQKKQLKSYERRTRWRNKVNHQQFTMSGLYYLNRTEKLVVVGEFTTIKTMLPWIPKEHRFHGMSVSDIYRDLMGKYISPKVHLHKRANSFIKSAFSQKKFIAIHLRGTDKHQEKQSNDIATINEQLIEHLTLLDKSLPIFVMTDDVRQIDAMRERFGARVSSIDVTRSDGDELGVHHTASDKQKIAEEVIVDMLIAAKSEYFFGCGFSYLACCVAAFRAKKSHTSLLPFDVLTRFTDIPVAGTFNIQ